MTQPKTRNKRTYAVWNVEEGRLASRSCTAPTRLSSALSTSLVSVLSGWCGTVDRLYVTGLPEWSTEEVREWLLQPTLKYGWALARAYQSDTGYCMTYVGPNGATLEVRDLGGWMACDDPKRALRCLEALDGLIASLWGRKHRLHLFASPVATGLVAWDRLNDEASFPTVSSECAEFIRGMGQGRIEFFPQPECRCPALYTYDRRLAYAAHCRSLGVGPGRWREDFLEQNLELATGKLRPGFWYAAFQVPEGWKGPGLLPFRRGSGFDYPADTHWVWIETQATSPELLLARECGWPIQMLGGFELSWPNEARLPDPLRKWVQGWLSLHATAQFHEELAVEERDLICGMIRRVLVQTIGVFYSPTRKTTQLLTPGEAVPDEAAPTLSWPDKNGVRTWQREETREARYYHPEWAAQIWGRARARLAEAALSVAPGDVVALLTDAILTSTPQPQLEGGSGIGQFRQKGVRAEPVTFIHSLTDLYAVLRG